MKTKNNTRGTVNNQLKGIILRGSAIICGLALISLTVNAQNLWAQFSNYSDNSKMAALEVEKFSEVTTSNEVLYARNATTPAESNSSTEAFALETELEEELELENWMTNGSYFTTANDFAAVETDEALRVESWMINSSYFSTTSASISGLIEIEIEKPLEIEAWMVMGEYFNTMEASNIEEPALRVESWMLENKYFDNKHAALENSENESSELEAWMTNDQVWGF